MANTPNLDLVKPAGTDQALISVINSNSDKIDAGFGSLSDQVAKRPIYEVVGVSGTTSENGQIDVSVINSYAYAYVLTNVSKGLATPYSVTVDVINNTTHKITLRIRRMSDNSALASTAVGFDCIIIGA